MVLALKKEAEPGHIGLMDLPAELRVDIFERVFADHRVTIRNSPPFIREHALLCVNRQIRNEAYQLFYSIAVFEVVHLSRLWRFAKEFDQVRLAMISRIHIEEAYHLRFERSTDEEAVWGPLDIAKADFEYVYNRVSGTAVRPDAIRLPQAVVSQAAVDCMVWCSQPELDNFETVTIEHETGFGIYKLCVVARKGTDVPQLRGMMLPSSSGRATDEAQSDIEHWRARCSGDLETIQRLNKNLSNRMV